MIVGSRTGAEESRLYRNANRPEGDAQMHFAHVSADGEVS